MYLSMKDSYARPDVSGFYSFDRGELRGFQLGDPGRDKYVEVDCFDSTGWGIKISLAAKRDAGPGLSQPEINRVINTLHLSQQPR
jgi:hypothetical protein